MIPPSSVIRIRRRTHVHIHPGIRCSETYEGILPGFNRVLAMSSESFPEPWAQWLEERGYEIPENPCDLYYASVKGYPEAEKRGKTYAPPRIQKKKAKAPL